MRPHVCAVSCVWVGSLEGNVGRGADIGALWYTCAIVFRAWRVHVRPCVEEGLSCEGQYRELGQTWGKVWDLRVGKSGGWSVIWAGSMSGSTKAGERKRGTADGETRTLADPEPDGRWNLAACQDRPDNGTRGEAAAVAEAADCSEAPRRRRFAGRDVSHGWTQVPGLIMWERGGGRDISPRERRQTPAANKTNNSRRASRTGLTGGGGGGGLGGDLAECESEEEVKDGDLDMLCNRTCRP
ncbi:hypothetical protein EDB80DRAFT_773480 [Ilyonectria destructans]|nr:hypothetical protein EDB80DRAFT_773480 [Ilyonectria destructans]